MLGSMHRHLIILFILSFFFFTHTKAQEHVPAPIDTSFFSWTPQFKHKVVNGIAVGFSAKPWTEWNGDTFLVSVNGLNLEVGAMGIIGGLWGTMYGLIGVNHDGKQVSFFSNSGYDSLEERHPNYGTYIKGLSISLGGIFDTHNQGLIINGLSGYSYEIEGVQISGMINSTLKLKGVSIAAIANVATDARGVQIGLINKCQTGNVVQIGLFNRIGKRVTPFINFRFKKQK